MGLSCHKYLGQKSKNAQILLGAPGGATLRIAGELAEKIPQRLPEGIVVQVASWPRSKVKQE
jgi:hypothetical protein